MAANTKKNQSSVKKILNWLKPGSARKNIVLFVLAFAIVGGGFMLFSSFASGFVVTASNISNGADSYTTNDCINNNSKSCTTVWVVVPPSGSIYTTDLDQYTSTTTSTTRNVCFTARKATAQAGQANFSVLIWTSGTTRVNKNQTFTIGSNTAYNNYCMSVKGFLIDQITVKATGSGSNSNILVSSISLE